MISVITTTYNRCELLKLALDSVLTQTFRDFEYIIIDDGSNDNTRNEISGYADKRVRYFYMNNTGYLSKARNRGLEEAKGNIVAFLDSDDYWHKNYLMELNTIYQNPEIVSVISNAQVFNEQVRYRLLDPGKLNALSGRLLQEHLLNDNLVIYPSCFSFRFNGRQRLNAQLKHGENDLILKTLAVGNSLISIKELVYIRKHDSNISAPKTYDSLFIQGYFEEYISLDFLRQNQLISISLYRKAYSRYLFKQAEKMYSIGSKGKAWTTYLRSFFKYPLRIKALARALRIDRFFN